MHRKLALGIAGAFFVFCFTAAAGNADSVRAAEKQWAKAVVARDFAALERILAPGLIYAHSTGVIQTKEEYLGKLRSGRQRYDAIEHEKTTVKVYGDAAVAHSIVVMKGESAGKPFDNRLMMMHFWVKENGAWRLAAHQTTRLEK